MTRLLMDAVLIVSVSASVIATAGAFDSLGDRASPAPQLVHPSRAPEVEQRPAFPVPEGAIVTTRRVIVRFVEADPDRATTALRPHGLGSERLPLSTALREIRTRSR